MRQAKKHLLIIEEMLKEKNRVNEELMKKVEEIEKREKENTLS